MERKIGDVVGVKSASVVEGAPLKQKGHIHMNAEFMPVISSSIIRVDKRRRGNKGSLEDIVDKVEMRQSVIKAMSPPAAENKAEQTVAGEIVSQDGGSLQVTEDALNIVPSVTASASSHPIVESASMDLAALAITHNWNVFNSYRMHIF